MHPDFSNLYIFAYAILKCALYIGFVPWLCGFVIVQNATARTYIFRWAKCLGMPVLGGERKDQPCKVVTRGGRNSVLIEFPDGYRAITSRNALRRAK